MHNKKLDVEHPVLTDPYKRSLNFSVPSWTSVSYIPSSKKVVELTEADIWKQESTVVLYTILYIQLFSFSCFPATTHETSALLFPFHRKDSSGEEWEGEDKTTTHPSLTPKSSLRTECAAKSPLAQAVFNSTPSMAENERVFSLEIQSENHGQMCVRKEQQEK